MASDTSPGVHQVSFRLADSPKLHSRGELLESLGLSKELSEEGVSRQAVALGRVHHPFDFDAATRFQTSNVHHSACIKAKVSSTVGLGFKAKQDETPEEARKNADEESVVDKVLNPLCETSFAEVLMDVAEDFYQVGNGYLEVVRRGGTPRTTSSPGATSRTNGEEITGIHHLPSSQCSVFIENYYYDRHYEVLTPGVDAIPRRFAVFGDKANFIRRMGNSGNSAIPSAPIVGDVDPDAVSELIAFRQPSSLSRWYGFPSWISAVASIELTQCLHQWKYDFFLNRGVPEYLLFITGKKLDAEDWKKLEDNLKGNIGLGNSHKSLALNIGDPDVRVVLEKLAGEGKEADSFVPMKENLAMDIVSAHQVPPLLAGIQIPGKLGSVNELPNALLAFDVLVTEPAQRLFKQILGRTLGNPKLNGGLPLALTDFHFRRVIDTIDLNTANTISRMRTPLAAARAEGRDVAEGLRD